MNSNYLGRKFLIVAGFSLATVAALFLRFINGGEFVTLCVALVGSFTAGDVALNFIHKRREPTLAEKFKQARDPSEWARNHEGNDGDGYDGK